MKLSVKTGSLVMATNATKVAETVFTSSMFWIPLCAIISAITTYNLYLQSNRDGQGEPFAWFSGASAWPSIGIDILAGLLSIHFLVKAYFSLQSNAAELTEEFSLTGLAPKASSWFGWDPVSGPPVGDTSSNDKPKPVSKIDVAALWQGYLQRCRPLRRLLRIVPMVVFYFLALCLLFDILGPPSHVPIRNFQLFVPIIFVTVVLFLLLSFFVLDAIHLHEGFLRQLSDRESSWPQKTFENYEYSADLPVTTQRDLADYWDLLLVASRTEAIGKIVYYPFVVLSLLIVARFGVFTNWTWSPSLLTAFALHAGLVFYTGWRLPLVANRYKNTVLERLKRRKRQTLTEARRLPEAADTLIEEIESMHQGAFAYLWEQPALRALVFPSGGLGLLSLLQHFVNS